MGASGAKCCDHEAMKLDDVVWRALQYVGRQFTPRDAFGPDEHLELRNCGVCHSTLAKVVQVPAPRTTTKPNLAAPLAEVSP